MSQGIRHNQGKPQWSLIPMKAIEPGVRVLMQGAEKYGTNNWRKGLLTREICESLLRHVYAYLEGEDNDSESGQPHVGHIIANAIFLSDMHQTRPDMDNRFSKEKTCCGKWDEYGKCTCVDNRREKEELKGGVLAAQIAEATARVNEINKKIVADGKAGEQRELKGGVLDESNFRQIAKDFADRLKGGQNANVGRVYPKSSWSDYVGAIINACESFDERFEKHYQKTVFSRDPVTGM